MAANANIWNPDVKSPEGPIDPAALPEYTLLPASPPESVVSYEPETGAQAASEAGSPAAAASGTHDGAGCGAETFSIFKLLYTGMLAIVLPPMIAGAAGLAAGAVMLYGCGKLLEGIGRGMSLVPETIYRRLVLKRFRMLRVSMSERRQIESQLENGQGADVEGQVALEDVEAGRLAGPVYI